jgi:hypothetical protein
MALPFNPLSIAQVVARNIVPIAGILFFHWSATSVLTLYLIDTLLMMTVIFAGVARSFAPPPVDDGWAAQANGEVGNVGIPLLISLFIAVPIGMPLIFMIGGDLDGLKATFTDPSFRTGVLVQVAAAFWSWLGLRHAIDAGYTPDQLRLKRRFALVFLRWIVLLMVAYTGIGILFGHYGAFIFVLLYAGASIVIEVAPDRFLRVMPGGAEDADPLPGETRSPPNTPIPAAPAPLRRKRKR